MKNNQWKYYGAVVLSMIFWSFSFVWVKIAYLSYGPLTTILLRLIISSAILLIFAKSMKRLQVPERKDFLLIGLMAFFEPFVYFMGESYGLQYVSSTVAAVIVATIPLFTPFTAWYFYKEKLSPMNLLGLIFSFVGVSLVVLNKSLSLEASPLGVSLEFLAVVGAIGYSTVLGRVASKYNAITIICYQNILGACLFLPFWLFLESGSFLQTSFDPKAFWAIVKLAIFASSLAFILFTISIRNIGINRSNIFINVIPVFVAIFAYFILGDELNIQKMAGITVVIAGLFLAQLKKRKPKHGTDPLYQA